ncbi:MAG: hypothetical protein ACJ8C4_14430 [Gemmataceae bacterium]
MTRRKKIALSVLAVVFAAVTAVAAVAMRAFHESMQYYYRDQR